MAAPDCITRSSAWRPRSSWRSICSTKNCIADGISGRPRDKLAHPLVQFPEDGFLVQRRPLIGRYGRDHRLADRLYQDELRPDNHTDGVVLMRRPFVIQWHRQSLE